MPLQRKAHKPSAEVSPGLQLLDAGQAARNLPFQPRRGHAVQRLRPRHLAGPRLHLFGGHCGGQVPLTPELLKGASLFGKAAFNPCEQIAVVGREASQRNPSDITGRPSGMNQWRPGPGFGQGQLHLSRKIQRFVKLSEHPKPLPSFIKVEAWFYLLCSGLNPNFDSHLGG